MNTKTAIRRLTVLRDFMRSLSRSESKHFNMGHWFKHQSDDGHSHVDPDKPITKGVLVGCGTSACAAGWAATIPTFRRAGFTFSRNDGFSIDPEDFFGLDCYQADQLFYEYKIKTPKQWAKRADGIIKELASSIG